MNYNINTNIDYETNDEKILIPIKNYYCSNCNRKGHTFKNCNEPIISNGIIGIYIKNFDYSLISRLENYIEKNLKIFNNHYNKKEQKSNKNLSSTNIIDKNNINENIQFLMVQRKHSLGYLEFMRGRYNIENTETLEYLIKQMTVEEIKNILNIDFEILWNNLWDSNNIKNKNHYKEYTQSKQKFLQVKSNNFDIFNNTKPLYNFNEWGFPKGRRELYESDLLCAIREFEEETNLLESNYTILDKCKSIRENLIGTNGIGYGHNYFLSIINNNSDFIDKNNKEIGQTKVLDILQCLDNIRPYHKNKIKIIKNLYNVINNFFEEHNTINS